MTKASFSRTAKLVPLTVRAASSNYLQGQWEKRGKERAAAPRGKGTAERQCKGGKDRQEQSKARARAERERTRSANKGLTTRNRQKETAEGKEDSSKVAMQFKVLQ